MQIEHVHESIPVSSTILTVANSLNQVVSQHDLQKQISHAVSEIIEQSV